MSSQQINVYQPYLDRFVAAHALSTKSMSIILTLIALQLRPRLSRQTAVDGIGVG